MNSCPSVKTFEDPAIALWVLDFCDVSIPEELKGLPQEYIASLMAKEALECLKPEFYLQQLFMKVLDTSQEEFSKLTEKEVAGIQSGLDYGYVLNIDPQPHPKNPHPPMKATEIINAFHHTAPRELPNTKGENPYSWDWHEVWSIIGYKKCRANRNLQTYVALFLRAYDTTNDQVRSHGGKESWADMMLPLTQMKERAAELPEVTNPYLWWAERTLDVPPLTPAQNREKNTLTFDAFGRKC
jgi:hypothetical protein